MRTTGNIFLNIDKKKQKPWDVSRYEFYYLYLAIQEYRWPHLSKDTLIFIVVCTNFSLSLWISRKLFLTTLQSRSKINYFDTHALFWKRKPKQVRPCDTKGRCNENSWRCIVDSAPVSSAIQVFLVPLKVQEIIVSMLMQQYEILPHIRYNWKKQYRSTSSRQKFLLLFFQKPFYMLKLCIAVYVLHRIHIVVKKYFFFF